MTLPLEAFKSIEYQENNNDLDHLLNLLPQYILNELIVQPRKEQLLEIVLDLGRIPQARYRDGTLLLGHQQVSQIDLATVVDKLGNFGDDNRVGIESTLHRISALRNRNGAIIGLTCRVGRIIRQSTTLIKDILDSGQSILVMGCPGIGKTTTLREIARVLADDLGKRVVIIDTSNEIAGDGDIPHPAIGQARRMQVPTPGLQHRMMIEAVENHTPEVIIIDEIGTEMEAQAARTIAERGIQLVATAHGNGLTSLIKNPTLSDLIGGVQSVTLGDEEAQRRSTQKTILERATKPTFPIAIEMHSSCRWSIHIDVAHAIDSILQNNKSNSPAHKNKADRPTFYSYDLLKSSDSKSHLHQETSKKNFFPWFSENLASSENFTVHNPSTLIHKLHIYCCGISCQLVERLIYIHNWYILLVDRVEQSDIVLTVRQYLSSHLQVRYYAQSNRIPILIVKSNTTAHIKQGMERLVQVYKRTN